MTDKELKDWCKTCNVEPPAMRFKCPECEHNPDKEQIIIDGVDVSGCDELWLNFEKNYDSKCIRFKDVYSQCSYCKDNPNCEYKQLQKEKFENLNNRQIVESAENLIYENSELYKNLKEKEQECEQIKEKYEALKLENQEGYEIVAELKHECEELKRKVELMMDCPDCKVDEYKKALEEIEGLVKNFCKDCDDYEDCNWDKEGCYYSLIPNLKDIINKAKGSNNER